LAIPLFWLVTLALNVGMNFALVPAWGARGAALSSTVSYALIFALVAFYFSRKTGRRLTDMFLLSKRELRELLSRMNQLASQAKAHK
jgi:Na+-driven multidrug efflux pump